MDMITLAMAKKYALPVVSIDWDTILSAYGANGEVVALTTEVCKQLNAVKNSGNTMLVKAITDSDGLGYVIALCSADYVNTNGVDIITTFECTVFVMGITMKIIIQEQPTGGWGIAVI